MSIEIPEKELVGIADHVRTVVVPAFRDLQAAAAAADTEVVGILHQPASSKLEAVFQKLAANAELGDAATAGLAKGLLDVVAKFGELDTKASGTPRLGGPR